MHSTGFDNPAFEDSPNWVEDIPVPPPIEGTQAFGGMAHLLRETQFSLADTVHRFRRHAIQVVNSSGLEAAASFHVVHDPTCQRIVLHRLLIHRNGTAIDQRPTASVETLRRESRLEAQIIDGRLTTSIHLRDVRVGDVVECSHSLIGEQPIFRGLFSEMMPMEGATPTAHIFRRIVATKGTWLSIKPSHDDLLPTVTDGDKNTEWRWSALNVGPAQLEQNTPDWLIPFRHVQVSAFRDWKQVCATLTPLFDIDQALPDDLAAEVDSIGLRLTDPAERTIAALKLIQQSIRYLSISIGEGSFRPRPLSEIWSSRFGDCKEMSLLLVVMLRRLGVDASAALVNSGARRGVHDLLPSPGAFNHCIVRAPVGAVVWVDPTRSGQPEKLAKLHQFDFGYALPLGEPSRDLEKLDVVDRSVVTTSCTQHLDLSAGSGEPVKLRVARVFRSYFAEYMRTRIATTPKSEIQRNYLAAVERLWAGAENTQDIAITDDAADNVVTIEESYSISGAWKAVDREPNLRQLQIVALELFNHVLLPQNSKRRHAHAVNFPAHSRERIEIKVPHHLHVTESDHTIETDAMRLHSKVTYDHFRTIVVEASIEAKQDFVAPGDVEATVNAIRKTDSRVNLVLSIPVQGTGEDADTAGIRFGFIFVIAGLVLLAIARSLFNPH